jgi:hypothetical protein
MLSDREKLERYESELAKSKETIAWLEAGDVKVDGVDTSALEAPGILETYKETVHVLEAAVARLKGNIN